MKKLTFIILCIINLFGLNAQEKQYYVYGVDFSHAKVYASGESVEQFAKAFEGINMLIVTEPEKYDFSRILNKKVNTVIEPMIKIVSSHDYSNLKSLSNTYDYTSYSSIIKSYDLPQTEGVGIVLVAKLLNKPMATASYELIMFDIASRKILYNNEFTGKAKGFGLRNFWAGSVYDIIKSVKLDIEN